MTILPLLQAAADVGAASPRGLMAVGAGLQLGALRQAPGLAAALMTIRHALLPAFAIAPKDFSRIVVRPPALLPGLGLAFISAPSRWVYSSHQRIRPTSFSPTSRLTARRVNKCSAP